MKPLYLGLLLLCFYQNAEAQLLDQLESQIGGVTRELEQVTDDVQDQVRKTAEEEISRQELLDNAIKPVNQLQRLVNESLPGILPILDKRGATAFVDVRVEDNWRAVEREWLILLDQSGLKVLSAIDAEIIEQTEFTELGLHLIRFRVAPSLDSFAELKKHFPENLHNQLDRNHIYNPQTARDNKKTSIEPANNSAFCSQPFKIGMIDTVVNTQHPAFAKSKIEKKILLRNLILPAHMAQQSRVF